MIDHIVVTASNIEATRETIGTRDQAKRLEPGCETWGIIYDGGQRGQMTRWPNGRGAVAFGGDSEWGDWTRSPKVPANEMVLLTDDGYAYNDAGDCVDNDPDVGIGQGGR